MAKTQEDMDEAQWMAQAFGVLFGDLLIEDAFRKKPVVISWAQPADVPYQSGGVTLGDAQLTATTDVPAATLKYDPPAGTLLQIDTHTLTARVHDDELYEAQPAQVKFTVAKAAAKITWKTPEPVSAVLGGFKPGPEQLNATVLPPEAGIVYTADGSAGLGVDSHTLTATIADTTHYQSEPASVDLAVNLARADVTWDAPAAQRWVKGGYVLGKLQLTAQMVKGPKKFTYDPPSGSKLEPDTHTLTISWQADDVFDAGSTSVDFVVEAVPAVITWTAPPKSKMVTAGVLLSRSQLSATCSVPDARVKFDPPLGTRRGVGKHDLLAALADPTHYAAEPVTVEWEVEASTPVITWEPPEPVFPGIDGYTLLEKLLNASISAGGGALTYAPAAGAKLEAGKVHELVVTSAETPDCASATARVKLEVRKMLPTITWVPPAEVDIVAGGYVVGLAVLNATSRPPGVALKYTPASGALLPIGRHVLKVESEKPAEADFEPVVRTLVVKPLETTITWAAPAAVTGVVNPVGTPARHRLVAAQLNAVRTAGDQALVYDPPLNTVLAPGNHDLSVTHPASALYGQARQTVRLMVLANARAKEGFDDACGGGGFRNPVEAAVKDDWDKDTNNVKTKARALMDAAKSLTGDELVKYMNAQVPDTADRASQSGQWPNEFWKVPGGMQVRYKEKGDQFTNPTGATPTPMFCIELLSKGCTTKFSGSPGDVAVKVSLDGELAPKGPGDADNAKGPSYTDGAMDATHLICRKKRDAVIVAPASVDIESGVALTPALLGIRLEPGDNVIKLNPLEGSTLKVGNNQNVQITAAASELFNKATLVSMKVNVAKAKPKISWATPPELNYNPKDGAKLGPKQINAEVDPPSFKAVMTYSPPLGRALEPGLHELSATIAGSAQNDAAEKKVTVLVRKATPQLSWKAPAALLDAGAGVELDDKVLNAVVNPKELELEYEPPEGTVLGVGTYTLQVRSKADKRFKQLVQTVTLEVKPKPVAQAAQPKTQTPQTTPKTQPPSGSQGQKKKKKPSGSGPQKKRL